MAVAGTSLSPSPPPSPSPSPLSFSSDTPLLAKPVASARLGYLSLPSSERSRLERRLVRRLDLRLFPCLLTFYLLNYIDRSALPSARILGLERDLSLSPYQYSTCLSILYIGYLIMQIPSNLLISRISHPSTYLCGCMILWGGVSAACSLVSSYEQLVVLRFLLGFVEAPFFPGAVYLLSAWYTPRELAMRTALLFGGMLLSGAFGAGLAIGISYLPQTTAAWRLLFGCEGSITVAFAILASFILPDYPATTSFLTPEERIVALGRLPPPKTEGTAWSALKSILVDPKVYALALNQFLLVLIGSFINFFPSLMSSLGSYDPNTTYALLIPPYLLAFLATTSFCYHADFTRSRALHILAALFACFVALVFLILGIMRYAALAMLLSAVYAAFDINLAWVSGVVGSWREKRAAAIAAVNMVANLGNFGSAYLEWDEDAEGKVGAWKVLVGATVMAGVLTAGLGSWIGWRAEENNGEAEDLGDAVPGDR